MIGMEPTLGVAPSDQARLFVLMCPVGPYYSTGIILPGVTRRSIIEITQTWPDLTVSERKITMGEVMAARAQGRLLEMFGSGTAAVVSPVGGLHYGGQLHSINTPG